MEITVSSSNLNTNATIRSYVFTVSTMSAENTINSPLGKATEYYGKSRVTREGVWKESAYIIPAIVEHRGD